MPYFTEMEGSIRKTKNETCICFHHSTMWFSKTHVFFFIYNIKCIHHSAITIMHMFQFSISSERTMWYFPNRSCCLSNCHNFFFFVFAETLGFQTNWNSIFVSIHTVEKFQITIVKQPITVPLTCGVGAHPRFFTLYSNVKFPPKVTGASMLFCN